MSKFNEFLEKNKITDRRLLGVSHRVERLGLEDRAIKLAHRRTKGGKATDAEKELAAKPRHSGRPVSAPLLRRARSGKPVSRWGQKRIMHAVNQVLKQRKKSEVTRVELFTGK